MLFTGRPSSVAKDRWFQFRLLLIASVAAILLRTLSVHVAIDDRFDKESILSVDQAFATARIKPSHSLEYLQRDVPEASLYMNGWKVRRRLLAFENFVKGNVELKDRWAKALKDYRPRGIVISAGGSRALLNSFVAVSILKKTLRCQLPIILTHYGEREMSNQTKAFFKEQIEDIEFLDLTSALKQWPSHHMSLDISENASQEQGYKLKIWSIYLAPFRQVLYLDADNTPITDPSELFDIEPFKKHGSLFWPDYWQDPVDLYLALNAVPDPWDVEGWLNVSSSDGAEDGSQLDVGEIMRRRPFQAESGQLLIDKEQHWDVLEYLLFLNTHNKFIYTRALGDKDTYRLAFVLAGKAKEYWQCPFAPAFPLHFVGEEVSSKIKRFKKPVFDNLGTLQLHPITGNPLFHHRTSDSKFQPERVPTKFRGPITHVTPSITRPQAGVMMWGNVEANLYGGPNTRYQWGLRSDQVYEFACETHKAEKNSFGSETAVRQYHHKYGDEWCACRPENLHLADLLCANRTLKEQYYNALPISIIQVPKVAQIYKISVAEAEAVDLLLYTE